MPRSGADSLRRALLMLGYDHAYYCFDQFDERADFERWYKLAKR